MDAANTVTWNLGTIAAGSSGSVTATAQVNNPITNGAVLQNFASIDSNETTAVDVGPVEVTAVSAPLLIISKQAPAAHIGAGQQFSYTIDYRNAGTDTATGITVTDALPAGLNFVSASAGGTEINGGVRWDLPDLPPGRSNQLLLTVEADSPIADGTVLSNDAKIDSNQTTQVVSATVDVTVDSQPVLTLAKTVSKTTANAGETLTYTLSWRNTGSDAATNVMLQDVLPDKTSYSNSTGNATVNGQQINWNLGTVAAGATGSVTLSALIVTPIADGTILHNTASIECTEFTIPATAFTDTTVSSAPRLSISKTVSKKSALAGETLVYTIEYRNLGTDEATGVALEDHLPDQVTFLSASGNYSESNGIITWDKGTLSAGNGGSVSVTVSVNSPIANGSVLHNSVTIVSNETPPVAAEVSTSDVRVSSEAVLTIGLTPSTAQARPGDTIVYHVSFGNSGTDLAGNAQVALGLPPNVTLISSSAGSIPAGNGVVWNVGALGAGASGTVSATVSIDSPLANGTRLVASANITDSLNHFASATALTLVSSAPQLEIMKSASTSVINPGRTLVYTLQYRNSGTDTATKVILEDLLPAELTFVSASGGGMESGGVVDWNLGDLAAGATGSVSLTVSVKSPMPDGTVIHNHASLDSNETSPVSTGQVDVVVNSAPRLLISKTASRPSASPGESITYTIHYSNTGTDQATGLVIEDHLPPEMTFGQASGGGSNNAGVVSWDIGTLPAGSSGSVSLSATIRSPLANGTVLHNTATIDSNETTPLSTGSIDVIVTSEPVLSLAKSASVKQVTPGNTVLYTLNFANTGTDKATGVSLQDHLPPETTFVSASSGGTHANGVVTWDLVSLPAGAKGSVSVTVRVNSPLSNGTTLHNSATIKSNEVPEVTPPVVNVLVSSAPSLTISKQASQTVARPGDNIVYTLSYTNQGTDQATGVILEDHLPPEVSFVSATANGTESGGIVDWNLGTIPAGAKGSVSVTASVNSPLVNGTILHNTVTINSSETGSTTAMPVDVNVSSSPRLEIEKFTNRQSASPDELITYTVNYRNSGTDAASNVVIEDILPAGVDFVSASSSGTETNGIVSWNIPSLAAGASGSVAVTVQVDNPLANGTILHNSATVSSTETTPVSALPVDVAVTSSPVLEILKSASADQVSAGSTLVYNIEYRNSGSDTATDLVLEDQLPLQSSLVSATSGGTLNNGALRWNLPDLPAGSSGSVGLTVRVDSPLANGTALHNSASIGSSETPPLSAAKTVTVSSAPVLTISASASASIVQAGGDQYVLTIEFGNSGNENASNVEITATVPPESTFGSATGGGNYSNGKVTWSALSLAAGSNGSVSVTLSVPGPEPDGLVLPHASAISATGVPPLAGNLVPVTIQSSPAFQLTKTPSAPIVNAGSLISYEITYFNAGTDAASNVVIIDTIPTNTSLVSASANAVDNGDYVSWDLGTVPAKSGGTLSLTLQVQSPLMNGTVVSNHAEITSVGTPPLSASGTFIVSSAPVLELIKSSTPQSSVQAGSQVSYSLKVTNSGNDAATRVLVSDNLPAGATVVAVGQEGQYDPNSKSVNWNISSLVAGASVELQYSVAIPVDLDNGTAWSNTASVQAQNAAPVTDAVILTIGSQPVLELVKSGGNSVEGGQNVSYTLEYRNTGNATARAVVLEDIIPAGMTFVEATAFGAESAGVVRWQLSNVGPGSGGTVSLTLQAPAGPSDGTLYTNTASLTASNAPPTTDSVVTVERSHIELDVLISGAPSPVPAGDPINFLVSFANLGNADSPGTMLRATLPPNTSFASASNGGELAGNEIVWNLGSLAALSGGSVSFLVNVATPLPNGTQLLSTATIEATGGLSDSATATVVVSSAPLIVAAKTSTDDAAFTGSEIGFVISIQNLGNETASDVVIVDRLPRPLEAISASDGGQINPTATSITWKLGDIEPGEPIADLSLQARVNYFEPEVTNIAVISTDQTPDLQVSATVTLIEVIEEIPTLNEYMLMMLALLMLAMGMKYISTGRFS